MGIDSNPNKFSHDIAFKKIEAGQLLTLESLPGADKGFVLALKTHGVDVARNKSLSNTVKLNRSG